MTSRTKHSLFSLLAFFGTLSLGAYLRWALAGKVDLAWDFKHLRHAHSHLGYYGILFPLAWSGWKSVGAPTPSSRTLTIYGVATLLSIVGFVRAGYGPEAIIGSTIVGAIWLLSAWPLRRRWRAIADPLAMMPWGVCAALACIPPIGLLLRRNPSLAQGFVTTFLTVLLFAVIVPSCLAKYKASLAPWPLLFVTALLGALSLGAWPSVWTRPGLLLYGVFLGIGVWRSSFPLELRAVWSLVAVGIVALALGFLPNTRLVAVGAIHFLILGPILASLTPPWWQLHLPLWAWLLYYLAVSLLAFPLVLAALGAGFWTASAAAVGGTSVVLWWLLVSGYQLFSRKHRQSTI